MRDGPALSVDVLTLFPEIFDSFLRVSLLGKAISGGVVAVTCTNPRDFAAGRHNTVDDTPYGGGPGMVLRPDPIAAAIEHVEATRGRTHRVLLSPRGRLFHQQAARALVVRSPLILICGRYEGVDERVATAFADEVVSIGDYVLAGGELAAAVMIEAVARLVPGVLGCHDSTIEESFATTRLEYPQYTRPAEFRGLAVPEILLSGDHKTIALWRRREALRVTVACRPDILQKHPLTEEERRLLDDDSLDAKVDSRPPSA